jgi:hypothetical protein
MRDKSNGRRVARRAWPPLAPEAAARMLRRVELLLGSVPLPEVTREEADWVFRQGRRAADG